MARTLADLRRTAAPHLYRQAVREAEYKRLDVGDITTDGTNSDLEAALLALCRRHRLPPPEVNARVGPFKVDRVLRFTHAQVMGDATGVAKAIRAALAAP